MPETPTMVKVGLSVLEKTWVHIAALSRMRDQTRRVGDELDTSHSFQVECVTTGEGTMRTRVKT